MNTTQLPTWKELSDQHKVATDRVMAAAFSGNESLKAKVTAELEDFTLRMKNGEYRDA